MNQPSSTATPANPAPVTRIARRRAKPGCEADYEARIRAMFASMRQSDGFLGADLLPPEVLGGDYQVGVRFASEAALQAWDESPARRTHHAMIATVADGDPDYRRLSGLEAWFAPAVVPASLHPPRSRMAFVTWLGIFPTVSLYLWLVAPWLQPLPFLLRTALLTGLIVVTMTWLVMPRLTRVMRSWLTAG